jgi:hypothetical protein
MALYLAASTSVLRLSCKSCSRKKRVAHWRTSNFGIQ